LDVRLTGRADYTVSDNIERRPVGEEVSGTIWAETVGLGINETWGPNTLDLLIEGGWEKIDGATRTDEEISRFMMDASFPWSSTGALAVSVEQSRETVPPDSEDLNQGRQLTDRLRAGINFAGRSSHGSSWESDFSARTEERSDRDLKEFISEVTWSKIFDEVRSFELAVGLTNGEDQALENAEIAWVEDRVSVVLNRQMSASSSMEYMLQRDGSYIQGTGPGTGRSERIGAGATYQGKISSRWEQAYGIGIDQVRTVSGEKFLEPRAQASVSGGQLRGARLTAIVTYGTQLPDPLDDQATWSRNATAQTSIDWTAARNLVFESEVSYRRSILFWDDDLGREDVMTSAQVSMDWQPPEVRWSFGLAAFSVGLTALAEERNSSGPNKTDPLNETRYGINLTGSLE
jgi:hypothetical protein